MSSHSSDSEKNNLDDKDIDEDQYAPADAIKRLEQSFLNLKDSYRRFELQPNLINADYCMKRLMRDVNQPEDFNSDMVYAQDAEYMIYSEKQVRIRYLIQLKSK